MQLIKILNLPKKSFAHIYSADRYENHFSKIENFIEITYISEGETQIKKQNQIIKAKKGDVICSLRDSDIEVLSNFPHEHHTVGINIEWCFSNDSFDGLFLPHITSVKEGTDDILHIIDSLIYNHSSAGAVAAKESLKILQLLCLINDKNQRIKNSVFPSEQLYCQRAKNYIHQNINMPLTQTMIANHLGISSGYLCSVFKKSEGTTLMKYINRIKLESIKSILDNENIHLYQAAEAFGYSDANYVSHLYKKMFGYNITDKPTVRTKNNNN